MVRRSRSETDERREPVFEVPRGGGLDLRLSAADRPTIAEDAEFVDVAPPGGLRAEPRFDGPSEDPLAAPKSRKRTPKRRGLLFRAVYWSGVLAIWAVLIVGGVVAWYAAHLPAIHSLAIPKRPPNVTLVGIDGSIIANRGETGGAAVDLDQLPPFLPQAFLAIEDRRFYGHFGIDPVGLARAVVTNFRAGHLSQGGSTITQQLAKNLFLSGERNIVRKAQEFVITLMLEALLSKRRILEIYLNNVEWGEGIFGAQAAARYYFRVDAARLGPLQAAQLAVMLPAPKRFEKRPHSPYVLGRASTVAARMEAVDPP